MQMQWFSALSMFPSYQNYFLTYYLHLVFHPQLSPRPTRAKIRCMFEMQLLAPVTICFTLRDESKDQIAE